MKSDTVKYIMKKDAFLFERSVESEGEVEKLLGEEPLCFSLICRGEKTYVKYCTEKGDAGAAVGTLFFFDTFGVGAKGALKEVTELFEREGKDCLAVWMSDTSLSVFAVKSGNETEIMLKKSFSEA